MKHQPASTSTLLTRQRRLIQLVARIDRRAQLHRLDNAVPVGLPEEWDLIRGVLVNFKRETQSGANQ